MKNNLGNKEVMAHNLRGTKIGENSGKPYRHRSLDSRGFSQKYLLQKKIKENSRKLKSVDKM